MNYKTLPAYSKVIYITVIVYAVTQLSVLANVLFCANAFDWTSWLALHSNLNDFAMRPWTLLTYMFTHANLADDPFHIVFNMLWLWSFGQFFMQRHSARQFVTFYLLSGMWAGFFYLLCYNVFPYFQIERHYSTLVGASGAVLALITSVGMLQPEQTVGLNLIVRTVWIKMKWLAAIVIALCLLCASPKNTGGTACHIGGILFGLFFAWQEKRGVDVTAWATKLVARITNAFHAIGRPKMTATRGGKRPNINADKQRDMDYNTQRHSQEAQIDAILDKISRHGYDGLSAEEKQILFDASRRNNRKN